MTNKVRELRQQQGLTQEDLARRVKVRRETIVFLEKNKYVPSLKLAHDLARCFGVPIEALFDFSDETP